MKGNLWTIACCETIENLELEIP